jgi:hypothetical protein
LSFSHSSRQPRDLKSRTPKSDDPHELYDIYDNLTFDTPQRQQPQRLLVRTPESTISHNSDRISHSLRRIARLESHRENDAEAVPIAIPPSPRVRFEAQSQSRRQEFASNSSEDTDSSSEPLASGNFEDFPSSLHRRSAPISRRTASAILFTLEEALRHPHPFTSDLVEENASMSDLLGGGPSASSGTGRGGNGNSNRPYTGPVPVGSPSNATGIKGPRDIMRERTAREAKRKAEQDAQERARAEEESRLIEEERRRSSDKRGGTAGAVAGQRTAGDGGYETGAVQPSGSQRPDRRAGDRTASGQTESVRPQDNTLAGRGTGGTAGDNSSTPGRVRGPSVSTGQPRPVQTQPTTRAPTGSNQAQAGTSSQVPQASESASTKRRATQSSFPHAFERWETLSSHWEGLTSYWIRRLQENSNEINRDPLSQQMSRQITDLSAAGANLFHAVVELQRLRASSERKFQRWFFETRAEQERAQEMQSMLEASLLKERNSRNEAIAEALAKESEKSSSEKLLVEMRRELQISKEEARRAWEELGRREQEERERTNSLRDGRPTIVGGVQVVPMMAGAPSGHGSTREPSQARDDSNYVAEGMEGHADDSDSTYRQHVRGQRAEQSDPFVETARPSGAPAAHTSPQGGTSAGGAYYPQSTKASTQSATAGPFYQQQHGTNIQSPDYDGRSEGTYSDDYEHDAQGNYILDNQGNRIRHRSPDSDDTEEYEASPTRAQEHARSQRYGTAPVSGVEYGSGPTSGPERPAGMYVQRGPVSYEGEGYGEDLEGPGQEWEAVPRHHHPTRLSDVLEEDERSRTSASQVSHGRI